VTIESPPDDARRGRERVDLGVTVGSGRRPDTEEDEVRRVHRVDGIIGEPQPARLEPAANARVDTALEEWRAPALQRRQLRPIDLQHHDVTVERREA